MSVVRRWLSVLLILLVATPVHAGWLYAPSSTLLSLTNTWTLLQNFNGGATVTSPLDVLYSSVLFDRLSVNSSGNLLIQATEKAPGAATAALAGLGAGNVNSGTHSYKITFVTASGETDAGAVSGTVTTTAGNGQVALSVIPTGSSFVTSRKVYRTAAGNAVTGPWLLLATIADNTTTTYADNTADASLGAAIPSANTAIDTRMTLTNAGNLIQPTIIGGTGTTSTLTLQSTSGVGTTGADIIFKVGNNGATEAARIVNSGNVGIGTTGPNRLLEVIDQGNTLDYQLRLGAAGTYYYDIGRNHTTGLLNFYGSQSGYNGYVFGGIDRTFMTILNSGNVGIGTTSPGNLLTVNGTSQLPTIIGGGGATSTLTLQPTSGVGTTGADIIFKVGNNGGTEVARILNSGDIKLSSGISIISADNLLLSGASGGLVALRINNINRWVVSSSGDFLSYSHNNIGDETNYAHSIYINASSILQGDNGQKFVQGRLTELVTVGSGLTTKATTIQIPADAIVDAVSVRVNTQPGGTSTLVVTSTTSGDQFQKGASISTAAGTTDPGTKGVPRNYNGVAAQTVTLTFNAPTTDALGVIRVDLVYHTMTPATS